MAMSRHTVTLQIGVVLLLSSLLLAVPASQETRPAPAASATPSLVPAVYAPVPARVDDFWLVPSDLSVGAAASSGLALAVERYESGDYAAANRILTSSTVAAGPLAGYAAYYLGLTELGLSRFSEARATFARIRAANPLGYLAGMAVMKEAEAAEAMADQAAAVALYGRLVTFDSALLDEVQYRLGKAQVAAGDATSGLRTLREVYYRSPLTEAGRLAGEGLQRLDALPNPGESTATFELLRDRAERLFGAGRYQDARRAFADLEPHAAGEARDAVAVRIAECDFYLKRYLSAQRQLAPFVERGSRQAEAQFFHLSTFRELRRADEYITRTRSIVDRFPDSPWTHEALNNLGTHYILEDEDEKAADVFRELFERFPTGSRSVRAAWKAGWWAYRTDQHARAARTFDLAAANFPDSDSRPSFLYWAGRAHEQLGDREMARARYRLVRADYLNSYYGRLASRRLGPESASSSRVVARPTSVRPSPGSGGVAGEGAGAGTVPLRIPTEVLIRSLLAAGLYDDGLKELEYAEREWGNSAAVQATIAWVHNRQGNMRRGITLMRRAYPQHVADGGETLPPAILKIVFPLDYWDLIRKHAEARKLDPYLVSALVAQESTFLPAVRSSANAYGLMQVLPSTGRRLARSLGMRYSRAILTQPEANLRLGTEYFSRLIAKFGEVHLALASYNAGDHRVARWVAERPGLEADEFIDDIPFPETQNYVKRILGTAEDYRALYGTK
jgi:soluble lytic murein transglycosylase